MKSLPEPIGDFLHEHHVVSLAACRDDVPWAASVFYAFDAVAVRLLFLSELHTRHGALLRANGRVAGTVAGQPMAIAEIRGVQFEGTAQVLDDETQRLPALDLYHARFPHARGIAAPLWAVRLRQLKLTDNRLGFGSKLQWERQGG